MQNLQEKLRDHLIPIVIFTLAFLVWGGVGYLFFEQRNTTSYRTPDLEKNYKLAQNYTPPTIQPDQKAGLPGITEILTQQIYMEPARVLSKGQDSLEIITASTDIPFSILVSQTPIFSGRFTSEGIETLEEVTVSVIRENQDIYLINNQFGFLEKIVIVR